MSLEIVASCDRDLTSGYINEQIKRELKEAPLGKPIFYIVPEQMTFQQEYELFKDDNIRGSLRAQVVSFSRLAWRVLQDVGGNTKQYISSTGKQMMLRKIVEERAEPFYMFQKAADKIGFLEELDGLITELKRHQITPDVLEAYIPYTQENGALNLKLKDLHYIYDRFDHYLKDKYIDGEDQLELLIKAIPKTGLLEGAHVYIDGFYRFTPQELNIVKELLQVAKNVTIALAVTEEELERPLDELDLFYQTKETYAMLKDMADDLAIEWKEPVFLTQNGKKKLPFLHLQRHFDVRPTPAFDEAVEGEILVAEAVHPRAEIEGVIQEILRLVRDEGYRYRDIALFVRETDQYYDLIQTLFNDYDIPVFIDEKRTMLNHPLIEFIRSLLDVIESNWRYDAMFRLLKTGFIKPTNDRHPLTNDAIDQLENYVLEFGIRRKSQWTDEHWVYHRFKGFEFAVQTDREKEFEEKLNAYKEQVTSWLKPFDERFSACRTVREYSEQLYLLLEQLEIPEQLEEKRQQYERMGNLEKAREEEQAWLAVMNLLDELVELIGEAKIDLAEYSNIINAGLEALQFSHVPPSMDHVIVGTIDHSRILNKKCVFLIGVNEGLWPKKAGIDGIINEEEREFLEHFGLKLAASNRRVLLDEQLYMYMAFTLPTDFLMVSYSLSDQEGNAKIPAQIVDRLYEFFPELGRPLLLTDPEEMHDAVRFVTTPQKTRGPLNVQLSRHLRGYRIDAIWWSVLDWYIENESKNGATRRTLQSLFYKNEPVDLNEQTVEKLVPKTVQTSVSRMEMLYRCSYQHFLRYHLKLEERRTYSLEAPDIGQLFHEALKTITEWIFASGKDFKEVTKTDAETYAKKSIDELAPVLQHHILASSNRYRYLKRKLQQVIAKATYVLSEQARASGFSPVGIELSFGYDKGLEPVKIPLPNGRELHLRGRIDRVDKAQINNELYLRIIDYKSGSQSLSLEEVYYGISLQMLTYLHVVLEQAQSWLKMGASPAGILYFHVHDAMLNDPEVATEEQLEKELFKKYKMNGLVLKDPDVAIMMDEHLAAGNSDIIPVRLKKDGDFYKNSRVADETAFALLRNYIETLIKRAGIHIVSGKIELNPYENDKGTACRFCPFRSVCQFDPILRENKYRRLVPLSDDEVLEHIEKELMESDEETDGSDKRW